MATVHVNGGDFHCEVAGEGPVALLLHGTGASTHSFRDLLPWLARRCTVVAPDLPGHGFTYYVIPTASPIREACVRMFGGQPIELYRRGMLEFARSVPDLVPRFKQLTLPVLGVCGALDPFPDQPEALGMSLPSQRR